MSIPSRNQEVLDSFSKIAEENGLSVSADQKEHILAWELTSSRKIILVLAKNDGGKVLVKFLPSFSELSLEQFIASENQFEEISIILNGVGIKTPITLKRHIDTSPHYVIREFVDGETLGKFAYKGATPQRQLINFALDLDNKLRNIYSDHLDISLERPDWFKLWQDEFRAREISVRKNFGDEVANRISASLGLQGSDKMTQSVIHSDLAPANLLSTGYEIKAIDWNGCRIGSRVIDLTTVWWFSFDLPGVRETLFQQIISRPTAQAVAESKDIARRVGGRLLSAFAEWLDYYKNLSNNAPIEDTKYPAELLSLKDKALQSYEVLYQLTT